MEKTLATSSELIARIRDDYAAGPRHQPLGNVEVVNQGDGTWMAYPGPPLENNDDKRAFLGAVARAKRDHDLADHELARQLRVGVPWRSPLAPVMELAQI